VAPQPKLASQLATRIEHEILHQRRPTGYRLGTEPELVERFGVSRAVLREAIRMVERHGLAETRRGPGGGFFVAQPAEAAIARVLSTYLQQIGIGIDEVFEARRLIDKAIVRQAAVRSTREAAEALEEIVHEQAEPISMETDGEFMDRLHTKLTTIARNPVLALFSNTLIQVQKHVGLGLRFSKKDTFELFHIYRDAYHNIALAFLDHDVERAEREFEGFLRRQHKEWSTRRPRARPPGETKRGDLLAQEISESIRAGKLEPGARIGSEAELLERYNVGREAFREAVRLLEEHGLCEMRRGVPGGLLVRAPDPSSVIRTASIFLAHQEIPPTLLREASLVFDPEVAALAAERATEEGAAQLVGQLGVMSVLPRRETADGARVLQGLICDLAQSRALALFSRICTLTGWGEGSPSQEALPSESVDAVRGYVARIIGAIRDGDAERARQLQTYTLELAFEWWNTLENDHPKA
jgi:DNA-binding FadR family transcriptional regulator